MSTFLAKAIKFRSLVKQLSKDEYLVFMGKIFDMNYFDLISTALFKHFIHAQSNKNNINHLNNINLTLSEIIQSRTTKPKLSLTNNIKLDKCPKALIGHIASFLFQNSYIKFSKTNRTIFIACNSPNMLNTLNLIPVKNYSPINLSQFKSLKRLVVNITQFNEFQLPQFNGHGQTILNELQYLKLYGNKSNGTNIESFMKQTCINLQNIKKLRLLAFGTMRNPFDTNEFLILLTKFKNIEMLGLTNINTARFEKDKLIQLRDLYPHLTGLKTSNGQASTNNILVNIFGNNLQYLSHSCNPTNRIDFSNINFSKLEEISLKKPSIEMINQILKSGQNIRKFYLLPHGNRGRVSSLSSEELTIIVPEIFKRKSLEYFEIDVNNQNGLLSVLNGIVNGLCQIKTYERKQIKIIINAKKECQIYLKNIIVNIEKLIRCLETSKISDFMFICNMKHIDEKCKSESNKNSICTQLKNISTNITVRSYSKQLYFVITNRDCKICGRTEAFCHVIS